MSDSDPKPNGPEPEIFDNPEFEEIQSASPVPASEPEPAPVAPAQTPTTPEPMAAVPTPTRTLELERVQLPPEAFREPEPPPARAPAPTVRAEATAVPPEAIPPAPVVAKPAEPPPTTSKPLPIPKGAIGAGAFVLGVLATWFVMHRPAKQPVVEAPAAPPPVAAPVVSLPFPPPQPVQTIADPEPTRPPETPKHAHHAVVNAVAKNEPPKTEPAKFFASKGVLGTYETGDVAAAIRVAQQDHADALYAKLESLQNALGTAAAAQKTKDLNRELASLEAASQLDLAIDRDSGPIRTRIHTRLVQASMEAGNRDSASHNTKSAIAHYRRALALAPNDAEAKRKLEALGAL